MRMSDWCSDVSSSDLRAGKSRRWVYATDLLVKRKLDCSAFRYLRPNAQRQADIFTLHSLERVAGTIPCGGIGTGHKRYGPANDNTGLLVVECHKVRCGKNIDTALLLHGDRTSTRLNSSH